jgi:transcriptional repressor NrdR
LNCKRQFTTYENADPADILAVKQGNKLTKFSHYKLLLSLWKACSHRQDLEEAVPYLTSNVEQQLYKHLSSLGGQTISKQDISAVVKKVLHGFDKVAYVKYASVHQTGSKDPALNRLLRKTKSTF